MNISALSILLCGFFVSCIAIAAEVLPSFSIEKTQRRFTFDEKNKWATIGLSKKKHSDPLEESEAFWLGLEDIRAANIQYKNALSDISLSTDEARQRVKALYQTETVNIHDAVELLSLEGAEKAQRGVGI